MIEINNDLVEIYYQMLVEEKFSPKQIRNKLYYMKTTGMNTEWLALKCAHAKMIINSGRDE